MAPPEQTARETQLVIDSRSLLHNYHFLKAKIRPETRFMAVVKANAYGSGAVEVAALLEKAAVDYFAVAYTDEGIALRKSGIKTPILVLHPQSVHFASLIEYSLEPAIYSHFVWEAFWQTAKKLEKIDYPIHLKFNTGLNRLGFNPDEAKEIAQKTHQNPHLKIQSVFSHLVASEDIKERAFTLEQISKFDIIRTEILLNLPYAPLFHCTNTSGILHYPEAQFDMVRSGIGLYGFGNEAKFDRQLQPIATLKTLISQIHRIKPGESVGYNRAYTATQPQVIATLPIGHADGLSRRLGNGVGFVTIGGQKASYVGNVCMDMLMVNVTDIKCNEGDEVIVFGQHPTADEIARLTDTISYEVITKISSRVKRVVV